MYLNTFAFVLQYSLVECRGNTYLLRDIVTMANVEKYLAPSIFLNHGGGPNPVLGTKNDQEIAKSLKILSNFVNMDRLKAFIVVTAHREEDVVIISSGKRHNLLYDYSNFPPESYQLKYEAPGEPELARKIHDALKNAGIPSRFDEVRGWDHGVFIPMLLINPAANKPIVQVSILKNQNASEHYALGAALYQFRKDGVAILGSGLSYHNMSEFGKAKFYNDGIVVNKIFDDFLNYVCTGDVERRKDIVKWCEMEQGLDSHPLGEADHLMPLIVCAGAGGQHPGKNIFNSIYQKKFIVSGFMWDQE